MQDLYSLEELSAPHKDGMKEGRGYGGKGAAWDVAARLGQSQPVLSKALDPLSTHSCPNHLEEQALFMCLMPPPHLRCLLRGLRLFLILPRHVVIKPESTAYS